MHMLDQKGAKKDYVRRILGMQVIEFAPERYYDFPVAVEYGYTMEQWENLPIEKQAELIASYRLQGMKSVVEEHERAQEEIWEKQYGSEGNSSQVDQIADSAKSERAS